jgi:hypothetical protein
VVRGARHRSAPYSRRPLHGCSAEVREESVAVVRGARHRSAPYSRRPLHGCSMDVRRRCVRSSWRSCAGRGTGPCPTVGGPSRGTPSFSRHIHVIRTALLRRPASMNHASSSVTPAFRFASNVTRSAPGWTFATASIPPMLIRAPFEAPMASPGPSVARAERADLLVLGRQRRVDRRRDLLRPALQLEAVAARPSPPAPPSAPWTSAPP